MAHSFIPSIYVVVLTSVAFCHGYYVSPNVWPFDQSKAFCSQICGSSLASIHSESQQTEAFQALTQRRVEIWGNDPGAFIGLSQSVVDSASDPHYQWSDQSKFDFGTEQAHSPWSATTQIGKSGKCVQMRQDKGSWESVECEKPSRALCNDCNGAQSTFAIIAEKMTRSDATLACSNRYGTTLASVYSESDRKEIEALIDIAGTAKQTFGSMFWLGLTVKMRNGNPQNLWDDGALSDYAEDVHAAPWSWLTRIQAGASESYWVFIGSDKKWRESLKDSGKEVLAHPICRVPSESELRLTSWSSTSEGAGWSKVRNRPHLLSPRTAVNSEMLMSGQQWYNSNEKPLRIRATFSVQVDTKVNHRAWSGVVLYAAGKHRHCFSYWIGITFVHHQWYVHIARHADADDQDKGYVAEAKLSLDVAKIKDFRMEVTVTHGNQFVVSMNDVVQLEYTELVIYEHFYKPLEDGMSGYVGWSTSGGPHCSTEVKLLYVSGAPRRVAAFDDSNECWHIQAEKVLITTPTPTTPAPRVDVRADVRALINEHHAEEQRKAARNNIIVFCLVGVGMLMVLCFILLLVAHCRMDQRKPTDPSVWRVVNRVFQAKLSGLRNRNRAAPASPSPDQPQSPPQSPQQSQTKGSQPPPPPQLQRDFHSQHPTSGGTGTETGTGTGTATAAASGTASGIATSAAHPVAGFAATTALPDPLPEHVVHIQMHTQMHNQRPPLTVGGVSYHDIQ